MSLQLTFYSIQWKELENAIGSKDKKLFRTALVVSESDIAEVFEAEDFEDGPNFEEALESWINGSVRGEAENDHKLVTTVGERLAFAALIRYFGKPVGDLSHSQGAGELFREYFIAQAAQSSLNPPYSLECLLSRPLFGWESEDFPFWGGLSNSELMAVSEALKRDAPVDPDEIVDKWLLGLWNSLNICRELSWDLATCYW